VSESASASRLIALARELEQVLEQQKAAAELSV